MRSWWRIGVTVLALAIPLARTFAVRQNDFRRECVEFQCPEIAFESGVKNLIDEATLNSEQCQDCNQCTSNGYSVCMTTRPNRANRTVEEQRIACSCAHSVPIDCHNRLDDTQHSASTSMKPYTICYLSALQAPPRPVAVSEKKSVIFTIEPFWLEPYWRDLKLDNLTFHYDFILKSPEHCEGTVVTSDDGVHSCNNAIPLNMTGDGIGVSVDDDYEHSDNYEQYDDELPEEVEIDRDIFVGASEVQVYYFVDVHQPRQLDTKAPSGTSVRDVKTSVESEILRYDLNSDFEQTDSLPPLPDSQEEDIDASEEDGYGEFFDDGKAMKNTGTEKEAKGKKVEPKLTNVNAGTDSRERSGNKDETSNGLTTSFTRTSMGEQGTVSDFKKDNEHEEAEDDEEERYVTKNANEARKSTETTQVPKNGDVKTSVEEESDLTAEDDQDSSENMQDFTFVEQMTRNKGLLARWIFGGTIAVCLLFILCVFIFRRRCCKNKGNSKSVGVNRYTIGGQSAATPSEKERLNK